MVKLQEVGSQDPLVFRRESQTHVLIWVEFSVKDTGIGIPADKIQAFFEPFVQMDSKTTRRHEGAGLGLSIVKKLTELMGGSIVITSSWEGYLPSSPSNPLDSDQVQTGTLVTVTLPLRAGETTAENE
jgi:signal transduction histidine kinase